VQASVQRSSGGRCVASAHPARHGRGGAPQGSGRGWWREAGGSAGGAAFIRCAAGRAGLCWRAAAEPRQQAGAAKQRGAAGLPFDGQATRVESGHASRVALARPFGAAQSKLQQRPSEGETLRLRNGRRPAETGRRPQRSATQGGDAAEAEAARPLTRRALERVLRTSSDGRCAQKLQRRPLASASFASCAS
jgi:hypothetical protein